MAGGHVAAAGECTGISPQAATQVGLRPPDDPFPITPAAVVTPKCTDGKGSWTFTVKAK